jgi:hypothetical protein
MAQQLTPGLVVIGVLWSMSIWTSTDPLTNKFSRSTAMFISCFAAFVLLTRVLRLA